MHVIIERSLWQWGKKKAMHAIARIWQNPWFSAESRTGLSSGRLAISSSGFDFIYPLWKNGICISIVEASLSCVRLYVVLNASLGLKIWLTALYLSRAVFTLVLVSWIANSHVSTALQGRPCASVRDLSPKVVKGKSNKGPPSRQTRQRQSKLKEYTSKGWNVNAMWLLAVGKKRK